MDADVITLAEVARRVGLSPQRVRQLADTDPAFPPRRREGRYWLISWTAAQAYFADRRPRPGRRWPPKE